MKRFASGAWRVLKGAPLALLAPVLLAAAAVFLLICDALCLLRPRRALETGTRPGTRAASIVIPNWNGRDLLEKYLPSVIASLEAHPENEIIVVDNGSEDGSAAFLRERFPQVRVLALERNLGFGGGSNAGFRAARNDIVVLLNSDMRVEPDFLAPLLDGLHGRKDLCGRLPDLFSRSRQAARRNRTHGRLVVARSAARPASRRSRHHGVCFRASMAAEVPALSTAGNFWSWAALTVCSRRFTWKTPTSATWRGNAAGKCSTSRPAWFITSIAEPSASASARPTFKRVLKKNFLLFTWKNIHDWRRLTGALLLHLGGFDVELALRRFTGEGRALRGHRAGVPAASSGSWRPARGPGRWRIFRTRRPSAGRWAGISAIRSALSPRSPILCGCFSFHHIRSFLPCMAARCLCTRRCANWPGCASCTLL